tara:strand:+ start:506 stop:1696 length:1191 start_codon:yes stop_codon:yes gene_type:complete
MDNINIVELISSCLNNDLSNQPIYLHEPDFSESKAKEYVNQCIESGWVSSAGKWVEKFEKKLSELTGAKYAIAVSNGTVALRLALFLVGVRNNDEVLIPPLTFVATANAVSHLGAKPHFIDIESESLGMSPYSLRQRLDSIAYRKNGNVYNRETGNRIAAVVPVHIFGLPAKIKDLKNICQMWNLPLIEDAAEALGSQILENEKFKSCGCFGDIGILSFNGNKVITTGGGGAILTNNKVFAEKAKHLSTTAKINHPWEFFHDQVAWNDRLPNINAALGCSQLESLEAKLEKKRLLHSKYTEVFSRYQDFEILKENKGTKSNYWLVTLRLLSKEDDVLRDKIISQAHKSNLYLRPAWTPLNKLPMYKDHPSDNLVICENQFKRLINLPSSPQLISQK